MPEAASVRIATLEDPTVTIKRDAQVRVGLDDQSVALRLSEDGPNELGVSQRRSLVMIVLEVLREPMFLLLLGAGGIYLTMGDAREALVLLGFVLVIVLVTVLQERRTDNTLSALRDLSSPRALVMRNGRAVRIPGTEVVRDDVLIVSEGDRVAADGVLLEAHELAANESLLTGESEPVSKQAGDDLLYAGTMVVRGQGIMRVTATGQRTELGRIGKSLDDIALATSPLQEEMALLTRRVAIIGISLCVLLVVLFWLTRGDLAGGVLAGIALAMGILPQEFPVILVVFLALAARRIAVHRVLTRRLNAIETLGEVSVLCVDKTGTLTENRMIVSALRIGDEELSTERLGSGDLPEPFHELLEYAVLASEISPHDPMEQAFHRLAAIQLEGSEHLHPTWALVREYELEIGLLAMTHIWHDDTEGRNVVASKGAPEAVMDLCHLPAQRCAVLREQAATMARRGLRVLGVAKSTLPAGLQMPGIQHDISFEWVGLVGLSDPLRAEVPDTVAQCQRAGIRVVMITGDHPATAMAIAAQAGIDGSDVLTGDQIATLDAQALGDRVGRVNVFARIKPHQKLALVNALKERGEIVAMTGDGVNDAPALKAAHIGIAMGGRGTDVAREAASLVLLEDDFASIVRAVALGRRTYVNMRQAMIYTIAVHVPIVALALLPVLFGLPIILAPVHIAFLELVIDPACSLAFESEPGRPGLMEQPPRDRSQRLLAGRDLLQSIILGACVSGAAIAAYALLAHFGFEADSAATGTFVLLVAAIGALLLPLRATSGSAVSLLSGLTRETRWILALTLCALVIASRVPLLASMLRLDVLPLDVWAGCLATGLALAIPLQGIKSLLPLTWRSAHESS